MKPSWAGQSCKCLEYCEPEETEMVGPLGQDAIIPRQGRLEGCHRMFAATHLICGLEACDE